jgi:hypothetical protein
MNRIWKKINISFVTLIHNIGLQECNYINLHILKAVHIEINYIRILKQMKITFPPTNFTFPRKKKKHWDTITYLDKN